MEGLPPAWRTALKKLLVTGWMKEVTGVQCLWKKYAEDGLQNGRLELYPIERLLPFSSAKLIECRFLASQWEGDLYS